MLNLFVVGAQGYTEEPIAIFDTWDDAFTLARRVWPNASGDVIAGRIHAVPYIVSPEVEDEEE